MVRSVAVVAAAAVASTVHASKWPVTTRAPPAKGGGFSSQQENSESGIPSDFDCALRQAAYTYGKQLLPRMGAFETLYYALNLNDPACPPAAMEADGEPVPVQAAEPVPAGAVFVAPQGGVDDDGARHHGAAAAGSEARPFATIQFALDACSDRGAACSAVVLRGGTHFLKETIVVTPRHSHTRLMAYPGEAPVVSGGTPLTNLQWKPCVRCSFSRDTRASMHTYVRAGAIVGAVLKSRTERENR